MINSGSDDDDDDFDISDVEPNDIDDMIRGKI